MSGKTLNLSLLLVMFLVGSLLIFSIGIVLLSGSHPVLKYFPGVGTTNGFFGDWVNPVFIIGFITIYLFELIVIVVARTTPSLDHTSEIVLLNLAMFIVYGMVLAFARIELLSRSVFLTELVLIFALVYISYTLKIRYAPSVICVLSRETFSELSHFKNVLWLCIDNINELNQHEFDAVAMNMQLRGDVDNQLTISDLVSNGITVYDSKKLIESMTGRVSLKHIAADDLTAFEPSGNYFRIKRVLDLLVVLVCLPVVLVVCIIIASIIKIDSRGSVLFTQTRIGHRGEKFQLMKFRTMFDEGEYRPRFAKRHDKRVTRVGRYLRSSRLDEVPQIWNVLMGEMSLVGPRPEQEYFVREYEKDIPFYAFRHSIRPGITGWAQIRHGYTEGKHGTIQKLEYDFFYLKRLSFWLDMIVLIHTIKTVVAGSGAR